MSIKVKGRRVWHCPPHFTKVDVSLNDWTARPTFAAGASLFDNDVDVASDIRNWLHTHIHHRFYLGAVTEISNKTIVHRDVVAFEDPSDATFFVLMREKLTTKS